jgi:transposase
MAKTKRMDQIKTIILTYLQCKTIKGTARRLRVSKNTVRQYLQFAHTLDADLERVLLSSQEELSLAFYQETQQASQGRGAIFDAQLSYWLKELTRVGVTRQLLWEEYQLKHPDGYGYSQFCERLRQQVGQSDLTLQIPHQAGRVLQLDFAGKKMNWVDVKTGLVHACEILIGVLPYSHYSFAIALPSQQGMDFVEGINRALLFFGGLPQVILSDNLKSFVTKANRYEPTFNELCVQLSAHYQFDLEATRVAKPKDKASVENLVRTVYSRIYAPLRDEVFHSIEELNTAIAQQLYRHNNTSFQKRAGTRQVCFEQDEKPLLSPLPSELFEPQKTVSAKVQRNYHVFLGEEKNYYSVPFQYAGKQATVVYGSKTVEVYIGHLRVATHTRLSRHDKYRYQTLHDHMPSNHQEWKKAQGYDAAYFMAQAQTIGPLTEWAMGQVLLGRIHQAQSYNACKGILALAKKVTSQRMEQACKRCQGVGKVTYTMLKNILDRNLDLPPEQPSLFSTPVHDNIRGPQAYQ